jgi:hypothetical protein
MGGRRLSVAVVLVGVPGGAWVGVGVLRAVQPCSAALTAAISSLIDTMPSPFVSIAAHADTADEPSCDVHADDQLVD